VLLFFLPFVRRTATRFKKVASGFAALFPFPSPLLSRPCLFRRKKPVPLLTPLEQGGKEISKNRRAARN